MTHSWNVELTLGLISRLRQSARDWQVDISIFVGILEEFGELATDLKMYSVKTEEEAGIAGEPNVVNFELKTRGSWTPLVLRVYPGKLLVLSDR